MNFQKSLKDKNNTIRNLYYTSPMINNIIRFHSIYPISKFKIIPDNNLHYLEQLKLINQIDGNNVKPGKNLLDLSKEYWLLGEVFPFINLNDFFIINPDEIEIISDGKQDLILVNGKPLKGILPLINNKDVYNLRGTSIIEPIINNLILFDNLDKDWLNKYHKEAEQYRKDIYKGLFFLKNVSELTLLKIYTDFRKKIENWFIKIIPDVHIDWPDLDMDDLKNNLGD